MKYIRPLHMYKCECIYKVRVCLIYLSAPLAFIVCGQCRGKYEYIYIYIYIYTVTTTYDLYSFRVK